MSTISNDSIALTEEAGQTNDTENDAVPNSIPLVVHEDSHAVNGNGNGTKRKRRNGNSSGNGRPEQTAGKPRCRNCGGWIRPDLRCANCNVTAVASWTPPEGYEPPITDEEMNARSKATKRFADEQVWSLRRRWRGSNLTVGAFIKAELTRPNGLKGGHVKLRDALRGTGAYKGT